MAKKTKKAESHDDRAHAPLPPSASSRWLACPPSMAYVKDLIARKVITKRESGEAAKRGTRIHETAAPAIEMLIRGITPKLPRNDEGKLAKAYAEFCHGIYEDALVLHNTTKHGVEAEAYICEECWGSSDFWCYSAKRFIVVDLKTGHEPVEAKGNTQLLIYAIGVMRKHKLPAPKEVELIIYQPGNGPDNCSRYVYTFNEFIEETRKINHGVKEASQYFGKKSVAMEKHLVAGDHCSWCDALGVCPRAKAHATAISSKNFQPVPVEKTQLPSPTKMEADQVALVLERAPMFSAWLEAVKERGLELIAKGHRVPGMKAVQKITRRAWESKLTDKDIAKKLGISVARISELRRKTPAQLEEDLSPAQKKILEKLVFKPIGEPCIVSESDRRTALPSTKVSFTPVSHTEDD